MLLTYLFFYLFIFILSPYWVNIIVWLIKIYIFFFQPDIEPRRPSIDRSVSLREPYRPPPRVGTSAESPAAPCRINTNHREAPPVPAARPQLSKTVGRAAGARLMPALRPPTDRPPKPPQRPVVAAPPPPSQPPPPPPSHRGSSTPTNITPGPKADVPVCIHFFFL